MRRRALVLAGLLTVGSFGVMVQPAAAFPPPGQCKNLAGECAGQSEFAPPKCADLPAGQQKKCER